MSLSDPIADMLTRIRNGLSARREPVNVRASNICEGIAKVLKTEGYITDFQRIEDTKQGLLRVYLKYGSMGEDVVTQIDRCSKPGLRIYKSVSDLPRPLNGMGICIVSTSKGIMSGKQCVENNVGGEVLCTVC